MHKHARVGIEIRKNVQTVLVAERRELLLKRLEADGKLVARDLAAELGVSEDSVRRDLRDLAAAGRCQRVYGGAVPVSRALVDYAARAAVEPESKQRIAARAAALIGPGDRVILDGGTTTLALVRSLPAALTATVITHSPTIAAALVDHPRIEILLLGGRIYKHSAVACGAATAEAAAGISADVFFLGVTGVHPEAGLTTGDAEEAAMKRTLAARAADTYVLASTEKVGAISPYKVLGLDDVTAVITDAPPDHLVLAQLRQRGTSIISAVRA
jgi:DeoR/GlpR family transcriptional regulator of sugar metabolism